MCSENTLSDIAIVRYGLISHIAKCSVSEAVNTLPFHGRGTGSIPVRNTKLGVINLT